MRSPEELTELFRSSGRKVTAQRQCIFRLLQGNVAHPSAEAVYESARAEMETISLKTVYQTLRELAELGEIAALDLGTGTVRFDPNVESAHHHLVCRACGKVRDLNVEFAELHVPPPDAQGYDVRSAEVVFRGLCDECRADQAVAAPDIAGSLADPTSSVAPVVPVPTAVPADPVPVPAAAAHVRT